MSMLGQQAAGLLETALLQIVMHAFPDMLEEESMNMPSAHSDLASYLGKADIGP
jgi:hypothetical protein